MDNNFSGIYAIVNKENGHQYIGSAVNIHVRWLRHYRRLRREIHKNRHLQHAWNKYGRDSFDVVVLEKVGNKENLINREQHYIDSFEPEYNICRVADNRLGCKHLEKTKKKIAQSHIGIRPDKATRKKLSESHKGYVMPEEQKKKISEANKGNYRGWSDKAVSQFTKDGEFLHTYKSIMAAERATGIGNGKIVRVCKGKRKTTGGYVWRYAEDGQ